MKYAPDLDSRDYPRPWSFETKVLVFERSVLGWQLGIANRLINGCKCEGRPAVPHSGYATLAIVMSYPEMVWQFAKGESSQNNSKTAFREGLAMVFDSLNADDAETIQLLDLVYDELRCGLYHDGRARKKVQTSHKFPALAVSEDKRAIYVNPHKLVPGFLKHFIGFVDGLRQTGADAEVGRKFERFFDECWPMALE
jgi:hypothetical protein